jgi:hypothetical protein
MSAGPPAPGTRAPPPRERPRHGPQRSREQDGGSTWHSVVQRLPVIQDRVLGPGVASSSLYTAVPGYVTFGDRPLGRSIGGEPPTPPLPGLLSASGG